MAEISTAIMTSPWGGGEMRAGEEWRGRLERVIITYLAYDWTLKQQAALTLAAHILK